MSGAHLLLNGAHHLEELVLSLHLLLHPIILILPGVHFDLLKRVPQLVIDHFAKKLHSELSLLVVNLLLSKDSCSYFVVLRVSHTESREKSRRPRDEVSETILPAEGMPALLLRAEGQHTLWLFWLVLALHQTDVVTLAQFACLRLLVLFLLITLLLGSGHHEHGVDQTRLHGRRFQCVRIN